jgi:hypothetical protein
LGLMVHKETILELIQEELTERINFAQKNMNKLRNKDGVEFMTWLGEWSALVDFKEWVDAIGREI